MTWKPSAPLERLTAWSAHRQLLDRRVGSALEALQSVVAVYSTHPTAPLALLARVAGLTTDEFRNLERQRQTVRIVAMRGSAFLVPTATAARIFAATRTPLEKLGPNLRNANLDLEIYRRLVPSVLECCSAPVTPAQLRACLPVPEDVYMVARILARQGQILRVGASLRTDQLKYVSTSAWLGQAFDDFDRQETLASLAEAYLRAFGPARVADFAWWSGCTRREAAAALSTCHTVDHGGLLLLEEDADAFDAVEPVDQQRLDVVPKWDSYTMGYAPDGRQRFIDDRFLPLAYTSVTGSPGATAGDGLPLILRGGRAIASWSHRFAGNALSISVRPFDDNEKAPINETTFARVASLLDASALNVRTECRDPVG